MGDSRASPYIIYKKKDMIDIEKYEIDVTVGNDQKMNCNLKGSVNIKLKGRETVKLTEVYTYPKQSRII